MRDNLIDRIVLERESQGLSQKEVAKRLRCHQSWVSKFEARKDDDIRIGDLRRYASVLGLEVKTFIARICTARKLNASS
jgi:transcriptional regulator with XRE-family HTH domain